MARPAGQVPDQPAVHRAKGQFAAFRSLARPGHMIQNPRNFGAGEIRVKHQPGAARDILLNAACAQGFANRCRAPVLPHNRRMDRLAGRALPHNRRLALVGNADRRHVPRPRAGLAQRFHRAAELAGQNLHRVMLHPARLRVELLKLMLRHGGNRARLVKQNGAGTRRSLVECKNVGHSFPSLPSADQSNTRGQRAARRGIAGLRTLRTAIEVDPRDKPTATPQCKRRTAPAESARSTPDQQLPASSAASSPRRSLRPRSGSPSAAPR